MQIKKIKKTSLEYVTFFSAALIFAINASAIPIEGASDAALTENAEALKSVVKIGLSETVMENGLPVEKKGVCSATVISKNIILTAKHCVENEKKPGLSLKKGSSLPLNDIENFEVVDVIKTEGTSLIEVDREGNQTATLTDIALVLVRPVSCKKPQLDVPSLEIAGEDEAKSLNKKMLLAGYGVTHYQNQDSGTLHAGYNTIVNNDEIKDFKPFTSLKKVGEKVSFQLPKGALAFLGSSKDQIIFESKAGDKLSKFSISRNTSVRKDSSIALFGDSGGPVIGFDATGKAYVAGVASSTAVDMVRNSKVQTIFDKDHKAIAKMPVPNPTGEEMVDEFVNLLVAEKFQQIIKSVGLVSDENVILQDFSNEIVHKRVTGAFYTAVSEDTNARFIRKALKKLEKARKKAASCEDKE